MSRYGYDYSLTPSRPKGWRSLFRNVLVVGAIAVISAVSGGVVVLDLLGPGSAGADRPALATSQAQPVRARVARAVTPTPAPPTANAVAAAEKPHAAAVTASAAPTQAPAQPSTTPTPQAASPANAASTVSTATVEEPKTVQVPESQLTFTTGYARRRAVQTAATTGAGTKTEVTRVEQQNQIGRGGTVKPRTTVAHQNADRRRVADEQQQRFDYARHQQAFAYGDPRAYRRPQQQGGLFSSNPFGGFFRGLF